MFRFAYAWQDDAVHHNVLASGQSRLHQTTSAKSPSDFAPFMNVYNNNSMVTHDHVCVLDANKCDPIDFLWELALKRHRANEPHTVQ